jgi:hypothetical protein
MCKHIIHQDADRSLHDTGELGQLIQFKSLYSNQCPQAITTTNMASTITHITGGPTVLVEYDGIRLLTDPTFDPPMLYEKKGPVQHHKTTGPTLSIEDIGKVDAVLLSHDISIIWIMLYVPCFLLSLLPTPLCLVLHVWEAMLWVYHHFKQFQ